MDGTGENREVWGVEWFGQNASALRRNIFIDRQTTRTAWEQSNETELRRLTRVGQGELRYLKHKWRAL